MPLFPFTRLHDRGDYEYSLTPIKGTLTFTLRRRPTLLLLPERGGGGAPSEEEKRSGRNSSSGQQSLANKGRPVAKIAGSGCENGREGGRGPRLQIWQS